MLYPKAYYNELKISNLVTCMAYAADLHKTRFTHVYPQGQRGEVEWAGFRNRLSRARHFTKLRRKSLH